MSTVYSSWNGNTVGQQPLLHDLRMPERPPSTEEPIAIDNPMKRKIELRRRPGDCPANLAGAAGIPERACDVAVGSSRNRLVFARQFEDLLGK